MAETMLRAAIPPSIGIARVGDSPEGFSIGPEDPAAHPAPDGGFRDAEGRLKRQAARFRSSGAEALVADASQAVRRTKLELRAAREAAPPVEYPAKPPHLGDVGSGYASVSSAASPVPSQKPRLFSSNWFQGM